MQGYLHSNWNFIWNSISLRSHNFFFPFQFHPIFFIIYIYLKYFSCHRLRSSRLKFKEVGFTYEYPLILGFSDLKSHICIYIVYLCSQFGKVFLNHWFISWIFYGQTLWFYPGFFHFFYNRLYKYIIIIKLTTNLHSTIYTNTLIHKRISIGPGFFYGQSDFNWKSNWKTNTS